MLKEVQLGIIKETFSAEIGVNSLFLVCICSPTL